MTNHTLAVPPQNEDAETNVIGAMLTSQNAITVASEHVHAEDFYLASLGAIYDACVRLYMDGAPVDAITVIDHLDKTGALDLAGGRQRIHELANLVPASANAGHYARIVREMAQLRALKSAGQQIVGLVDTRAGETRDLLDQAEQLVYDLAQHTTAADLRPLEQSLPGTYEQALTRGPSAVTGLATGYTLLDSLTAGLQPGNLIVLAARPSMGKTALATSIALHVAATDHQPVAFFSLEMGVEEINRRLLALRAGVNLHNVNTGRLDGTDRVCLEHAYEDLRHAPLHIDDSAGIRPIEIRSKARRMKSRHGLSLIVVDYLQLMVGEAKPENRTQEVSQISRSLKQIARDLNVPVVALSQLSRNLEFRHDKRPILSDLRESGSIEQDADVVLFVYRDSVYNRDADETEAELILAKHRNGPTGQVMLDWQKARAEFRNAS